MEVKRLKMFISEQKYHLGLVCRRFAVLASAMGLRLPRLIAVGLFLVFFLPEGAHGQGRYDMSTLFKKGAWTVELTFDTVDNDYWCSANTTNRSGQTFALTVYDSAQFTIFIFDHTWNITPRPLRFLIDVDYSRWTMDGEGDGPSISITPEDGDSAVRFMRQVMRGNAVALMTVEERRLATFSLNGSFAAVSSLFECYQRISKSHSQNGTDPFLSPADPF